MISKQQKIGRCVSFRKSLEEPETERLEAYNALIEWANSKMVMFDATGQP